MALFKAWCAGTEDKSKKKTFRTCLEKVAAVQPFLRSWAKPSGRTTTRLTRSLTMSPALGYDRASEI